MEPTLPSLDRRPLFDDVRELMLGWCLWLLGSWAVTLTLDTPVPSVRWMVYSSVIGLMAVWPAVRLGQGAGSPGHPAAALAVMDWVCFMVILQAVIWPLSLVAQWPWWQALWLFGAIAAWTLATAAIIAAGRAWAGGVPRSVAMLGALLLLVGEPLLLGLTGGALPEPLRLSPVRVIDALSRRPDILDMPPVRAQVASVALAATIVWVFILAWAWWARSRGSRSSSLPPDGP